MAENLRAYFKKLDRALSKIKRRVLSRHLMLARAVIAVFLFVIFGALLIGLKNLVAASSLGESLAMAGNFLFLPDKIETYEGKTNILLLGKAGTDPVLTDTMILVSLNQKEQRITLLSIPRDIWVTHFADKINSAYSRGNHAAAGGGLVLARSVVEEVVGFPVHYALAFDFEGFEEIIDILGGVEIDVERSFTDTKFPIPGLENDECGGDPEFSCRYETLSFEKGLQLMDGKTALKYARSRHSEDPEEGTDLARAARQQKVLIAIKDKVASSDTLTSPVRLSRLWSAFWEITETDLTKPQMAIVARRILDARGNVASYTLPENLLFNPPYSEEYRNLYVFIPAALDWQEVHQWVRGIF